MLWLQIVNEKGKLQMINVMVCTYNEDMETVQACVQHLLDSPEPVYCHKHIYIGDDGAKKKFPCSEEKRQMVERFNASVCLPLPSTFDSEAHMRSWQCCPAELDCLEGMAATCASICHADPRVSTRAGDAWCSHAVEVRPNMNC
jgi:hypothetical protein